MPVSGLVVASERYFLENDNAIVGYFIIELGTR